MPYALAGAVVGYQTAASAGCDVGASYSYFVEGIDARGALTGDFEIGEGVYSVGFLTPVTVSDSSNGCARVDWPSGAKRIGLTVTAATVAKIDIPNFTYAERAGLRTITGQTAQVDGLGYFSFSAGNTEADNDETIFTTTGGTWKLSGVSPEYMALQLFMAKQ